MKRIVLSTVLALSVLVSVGLAEVASADPLSIKAVMSPVEQIYVDLPTPQKHFVLFVKRQGRATGAGALAGAELTEYGTHAIRPGVGGAPRGDLAAKLPSGDQAGIQGEVQATS